MYIDKCWYGTQEQKEVPVWCTGIYRPISSTECKEAVMDQSPGETDENN
jgi:hypothetical protein